MALPSPPASISLSQVNVELGNPGTTAISMNDAAVRTLFAKPTGAISMSDGFGKSNVPPVAPITSITLTMPHPQPLPGVPGIPAPNQPSVQYNAGPIPGTFNSIPGPSSPRSGTLSNGSSCSPNPLARQFVFAAGGATPGYLQLSAPNRIGVREKNITVSYSGGPLGPGSQTDATGLSYSISADCPDWGPLSGVPSPTVSNIPVRVVSTAAPAIVVDVGTNRATRGTSPLFVPYGNFPHTTSYPGSPAIPVPTPNNGYYQNIHTRYVVTGTAPAPLGGASGSTSFGVVCLPLDTEVTMGDGSVKPMKDVKVGDKVKTFDPDTNEISSNEVTHLLKRHVASELIHIKLKNNIEFRATPEHECWIRRKDEGMWVMAELIEPGDFMMTEGIEYKVVESMERVEYEEGIEVGNFSVADAHVYFANKVLLHNFTAI